MGKLDDAVPWLECALTATHNDTRHYPHLNLGRIALAKGDLLKAANEFGQAREVQPRSLTARRTLAVLSTQLNWLNSFLSPDSGMRYALPSRRSDQGLLLC